MTRKTLFYIVTLCLLTFCFSSCNNDKNDQVLEIPSTIKADFNKRFPAAKVVSVNNWSDGFCEISMIDNDKNEVNTIYVNNIWKVSVTKLHSLEDISYKAKDTFLSSEYGYEQIEEIFKTERDRIENPVFTIRLTHSLKWSEDVLHYVYIDSDGLFLKAHTSIINDPLSFPDLPSRHFDFIEERYKGAVIKGYMNAGIHEFFILHNSIIKYVCFSGYSPLDQSMWFETRFELSKDAIIPDNVIKSLQKEHPEFTYTNIYYTESRDGNSYLFFDEDSNPPFGYNIPEDIKNIE